MESIQVSKKSQVKFVYHKCLFSTIDNGYKDNVPISMYFNLWEHGYYHNDHIINDTILHYEMQLSLTDSDTNTFVRFMKANPTKHLTKLHCNSISLYRMWSIAYSHEKTKNLIKILNEDWLTDITEIKLTSIRLIIIDDVIGGIPDNDVAEVIEAIKNHPLNKLKQFSLISIGHHE